MTHEAGPSGRAAGDVDGPAGGAGAASPETVLVASNRGPFSFTSGPGGTRAVRRGGGGLVSGLTAVARHTPVLWVCAALSEADRAAARAAPSGRLDLAGHDLGGGAVQMLDVPPDVFERAYNGVANATLWFVQHLLYDTPRSPVFDRAWRERWRGYVEYNARFAEALAREAPAAARVMVQDYHLSLVPGMLRRTRPDLRVAHFSHTPWAPAGYFRLLPDDVAADVLTGVLGADHAGFLSARWADAFLDCCADVLGAAVDRTARTVTHHGRTTRLGVHPLGTDRALLTERASRPDVDAHLAALRDALGDRRVVVRVDRTELSKNVVRGLDAYREMLRRHPEWRGHVVHLAFAYPSREHLPEYRAYTAAVRETARAIEEEFATPDWQPLLLDMDDDYPRSLAALRVADVLLVNPVRDGMNLVAKEGAVLAERGCALVLSREAGAADELGGDALLVNPFDVSGTADALHTALTLPDDERRARAARLAEAATARPPERWFADQLDALTPVG
jgi:trehalose 6-phosphate synthase